jgi:hypothetical protein
MCVCMRCGLRSEAACSSGYTPFLNFDIQDLSDAVPRLLMLGATMDGPIKYPAHGKVGALQSLQWWR